MTMSIVNMIDLGFIERAVSAPCGRGIRKQISFDNSHRDAVSVVWYLPHAVSPSHQGLVIYLSGDITLRKPLDFQSAKI